MDRGTQHTLTTPRQKYVKLTTLSLNHTFETRVLTPSLYVCKIWLVQLTSRKEAFTCLESGSTTQVTACRRQAAERFIITVQFTSSPHCLNLRVSQWSAEFQFQRDANVAGAHEPSMPGTFPGSKKAIVLR